jgi:preprotein translocase subunit SecF
LYNIIGKRYWFFLLSALVIVPGAFALGVWHLKLGPDFTGGSEMTVTTPVKTAQGKIQNIVLKAAPKATIAFIQPVQADLTSLTKKCPTDCQYIVRTSFLTTRQYEKIKTSVDHAKWPPYHGEVKASVGAFQSVSGTVAASTTQYAIEAVIAAAIAILLYITFAFRKMPHPFRYGAAAVIAMLHDVLVVVGIFAILGKALNVEIDATFVTAMLTIIGFSVHDTIVIFDRIRENVTRRTGEAFEAVVNHSVLQSFVRSINTSFTVVLTLGAIFFFSGESIRYFVLAMLIGIISGTYSSIFNASPILVVWQTGELTRIFSREKGPETPAGAAITQRA